MPQPGASSRRPARGHERMFVSDAVSLPGGMQAGASAPACRGREYSRSRESKDVGQRRLLRTRAGSSTLLVARRDQRYGVLGKTRRMGPGRTVGHHRRCGSHSSSSIGTSQGRARVRVLTAACQGFRPTAPSRCEPPLTGCTGHPLRHQSVARQTQRHTCAEPRAIPTTGRPMRRSFRSAPKAKVRARTRDRA